jgi:hypothetical protein
MNDVDLPVHVGAPPEPNNDDGWTFPVGASCEYKRHLRELMS